MKKIVLLALSALTLVVNSNAKNIATVSNIADLTTMATRAIESKSLSLETTEVEQFKEIIAKHKSLLCSLDQLSLGTQISLLNFLEGNQVSTIMSLRQSLPKIKQCLTTGRNIVLTDKEKNLLIQLVQSNIFKTIYDKKDDILKILPSGINSGIQALILDIQTKIGRL